MSPVDSEFAAPAHDPAFATDATVEIADVSVWFGPKVALSELSCSFGPGVTGLLGPNGAGKTTLMRAMTTRLAAKMNDPAVGVTFNLCHWLKVEGSTRDPAPVLRAALPRLLFVTINGADTGDTKTMGWERLIRPLGEGSYDVGAVLKTLRATGYEGPIGFQGYGIQGDARAVLAKTMAEWKAMQP